jgi:hydroxyethylthiazole kinase
LKQVAKTVVFENALEAIRMLRKEDARVHSITNTVAQNFTANVLLACNARPSMTVNPDEVEAFTKRADALHINLGTLDHDRMKAIQTSIDMANQRTIPILVDPVMAHVSPLRAEFALGIVKQVSILRGNEDEIKLLEPEISTETCIVKTGETDQITYQDTKLNVENGHPIMANIIATGCALGGLITALSAKSKDPISASMAGLLWFGIAGEIAAENSQGPGSFSPCFIDTLHNVSLNELERRAKYS